MGKGFGDRLAKGGNRAAFPASEVGVSNKKFDDATKDFDPQGFLARAAAEDQASRDRKAQREIDAEATRIQQDQEREARRAADAEAEKLEEPEDVPEFSRRYSNTE